MNWGQEQVECMYLRMTSGGHLCNTFYPHREKTLVKLTNTKSICLQKHMFLKEKLLGVSQFD